jgi:predicted metalloprotease with PDZ domain
MLRRATALALTIASAPFGANLTQHMEVPAAGTRLRISFSEPVERERAQKLATWLQQVADGVGKVNGSLPWPEITVRLVDDYRSSAAVAFGRVTRRNGMAIDLRVNLDRPIDEFYTDWKATHEFSHLLLPRIDWRQRWISEGFASYYQNVLMARAGHYTREQAIAKLTSGFERGRASRPELSPNEAAREGIRRARYKIYWSGAAVALLADTQLRQRSGGAQSLDTALDRFRNCCLDDDREWTGETLFRKLDALVDEPVFMPLYRQYADTPGFPDVAVALADDALLKRIFAVRTSPN